MEKYLKRLYSRYLNRKGAVKFRGVIGHLILVSGTTASGETTFLDNPQIRLDVKDLPPELSQLFELAKSRTDPWAADRRRESRIETILMGVDISSPLRGFTGEELTREKVFAKINPNLFHAGLDNLMSRAERLDIIHMSVRREENLRRRMNRMMLVGEPECVSPSVLFCLTDATDDSALHRALNRKWIAFCEGYDASCIHVLEANGSRYSFISREAYVNELEQGYRK